MYVYIVQSFDSIALLYLNSSLTRNLHYVVDHDQGDIIVAHCTNVVERLLAADPSKSSATFFIVIVKVFTP